jgi:hypothetical protein
MGEVGHTSPYGEYMRKLYRVDGAPPDLAELSRLAGEIAKLAASALV